MNESCSAVYALKSSNDRHAIASLAAGFESLHSEMDIKGNPFDFRATNLANLAPKLWSK